jgi:hypothetical protein
MNPLKNKVTLSTGIVFISLCLQLSGCAAGAGNP